MKKRKLINKKIKKLVDKKCKFCEQQDYCTLQVHRIIPGCEGGKYTETNTITCCSCCHNKIHGNKIKIDRKYPSTTGWVLHYFDEEGKEHWD
jgi:hypothetical protein